MQVVMVTKRWDSSDLELVEWEISGDRLMRRRGEWAGNVPDAITNELFFDHKTMFEGATASTKFRFFCNASEIPASDIGENRAAIDAVVLEGFSKIRGGGNRVTIAVAAGEAVGR